MAEGYITTENDEQLTGKAGLRIFFRSWQPARPRAVVVINHGVNSHSGQYIWPSQQFAAQGFAVYAIDMRGRGKSEGLPRYFVDHVADYVGDLALLIDSAKSRNPGLPVFLLGHSAGGVVACSYTLDHQDELAGLVCESFAYRVPAPGFALTVIKGLAAIAPRLPVLTLNNKDFTRDPEALARLNSDPLIAGEKQPAQTVAALVRAGERLKAEFGRITLPVLIMHGTADRATVPAGSEEFHAKAGSKDKTLKLYEGHFHDLLSDVGKEAVIQDIIDWVNARLPAAA